jgi:hypothetical protein
MIWEEITFGYRREFRDKKDGKCTVEITKKQQFGKAKVVVRLQSGGMVLFKKATVTLSWTNRLGLQKVVLNFSESQCVDRHDGACASVLCCLRNDLCLKIVAVLHEDDEDKEDKVGDFDDDKENSLASDWGARFNDDYLSDIKVIAGKSSFHCHKLVLASRSDVFKAMFSHGNFKESVGGEIILEEDPANVEQFLKFLYTDEVKLDENNAAKLLLIGDKYNVQKLKNTCHRFLVKEQMDTDYCCKVLVIANLTHCDILENKCCAFICKNLAKVMKTEGWAEISRDHPKLFQVILEKNATALSN